MSEEHTEVEYNDLVKVVTEQALELQKLRLIIKLYKGCSVYHANDCGSHYGRDCYCAYEKLQRVKND